MKEIGDTPDWVMGLIKKHPDVAVGESVRFDDQVVGYKCRRGSRLFYLVYAGYIFPQSRIGIAASVLEKAGKEGANIIACIDKRFYVFIYNDIFNAHPKCDMIGNLPVYLIPIHLGVNINKIKSKSSQLPMGF